MEESIMNSCKKKLSEQIIYVMMNLSQTNTKDFDLLVFQDRNQAYGAYALRKSYSSTMLKSLLIGVAFTASLLAAPYLTDYFKKEKVVYKSTPYSIPGPTILDDKKDDDKPKLPPKKTDEQPETNTRIWTNPVVTTDMVNDTLPTMDEFEKFNPGLSNSNGELGGLGMPEGCDQCDEVVNENGPGKVHDFVTIEVKPEFPGGEEAMWKFFNENLVYPQHAKDIQLQGRVYVTFVIDEWGNVTKVAVPREIGGGLDEEAKRVVSMMPRWSPGRQAGRPVKVSFQLPISFKLQ